MCAALNAATTRRQGHCCVRQGIDNLVPWSLVAGTRRAIARSLAFARASRSSRPRNRRCWNGGGGCEDAPAAAPGDPVIRFLGVGSTLGDRVTYMLGGVVGGGEGDKYGLFRC